SALSVGLRSMYPQPRVAAAWAMVALYCTTVVSRLTTSGTEITWVSEQSSVVGVPPAACATSGAPKWNGTRTRAVSPGWMTSESRQFGRTVSVGMDAWAAKYARPCDEYGAAVICTTPISRPPWIVPNESRLSMKALNRVVNVAGGVTSVPALALVSSIAPGTSLLPIHTVTNV